MVLSDRWEEQARNWIAWARTPGHDSYWRFHRDQFLALLPPPGRLTVDVGCGEGRLPRDLKARGYHIVGVDASPTLIDAARQADPEGDYRCSNATALPLDNESCDLAVAFMTLHDIDDLQRALDEIARVLVRDGVLCAALVHPLNSAGRFLEKSATSPFVINGTYLGEFDYASDESRDDLEMVFHSRHRPIDAYSRALEQSGFAIDAIREPAVPDKALTEARTGRWQRVPLFLHVRACKR